jgi:hypothetical protein
MIRGMRAPSTSRLAVTVAVSLAACGPQRGGARDGGSAEVPGTSAGTSAGRDGGSAEVPGTSAGPLPFRRRPWWHLGLGVALKDTRRRDADGIFVGYAGYGVTDDEVRAWVTALYEADLGARGVRYVYAVRGPADVGYEGRELANSALVEDMLPRLAASERPLIVAAHSSGAFAACEFLEQVFLRDFDPDRIAVDRVVYFNLDGAQGCLDEAAVGQLHALAFVDARGPHGLSLNAPSMAEGANRFPDALHLTHDASESGCGPGGRMCLHATLVNTRPHDPVSGSRISDYTDFAGRAVNTFYLSAVLGEPHL